MPVVVIGCMHAFPHINAPQFINDWNALSRRKQKSFNRIYWNLITYVAVVSSLLSSLHCLACSVPIYSMHWEVDWRWKLKCCSGRMIHGKFIGDLGFHWVSFNARMASDQLDVAIHFAPHLIYWINKMEKAMSNQTKQNSNNNKANVRQRKKSQ